MPMRLVLVLVLLWAQTLGWQHRIAHVPGHASSAHSVAHGHVHTPSAGPNSLVRPGADTQTAGAPSGVSLETDGVADLAEVASASETARFGHDAGQTDACRIYDQSALADLVGVEVPVLSGVPERVAAVPSAPTASWSAPLSAYRARAPPAQA